MVSLKLFLTAEDQCSYLADRQSQSLFIDPDAALDPVLYAQLLGSGFRRSGGHVYTTHCNDCIACIPIRLPVDLFKPNRSQKRTIGLNHDLDLRQVHEVTDEHVALYRKYMTVRHRESPMANYCLEECRQFMHADWCDTLFLEFRLKQELIAVAVTDQLPDSLSAVYTYFDPDHEKRAPGVYAILNQIELARRLNLDWLYLGFWVKDCVKMSYKTNYLPLELRIDKKWHQFTAKTSIQLLSN